VFLYFKFLERDGNRGPRPASVILIGLDWIEASRGFVSDSWAFLLTEFNVRQIEPAMR